MSAGALHPFRQFLVSGSERGGFETDDALAAVLPLMHQVLTVHGEGLVAPLQGFQDLRVEEAEASRLAFDAAKAAPARKHFARVEQLQTPLSAAVEVVGQMRRTADVDAATVEVTNLGVGQRQDELKQPVYLPGYVSWEHVIGHHDELTDIFSLGLILASVACGLDFADPEDVATFANNRENLFAVNPRLNPVLASAIGQMTGLNRHRRAQDLGALISRLENYREQPTEFDFIRIHGFKESPLSGRRKLIQAHLRDRLFEISRRNRLLYFRATQQTLNLTVASVPLLLDYRNIKLEQLFVWHPQLAAAIIDGAPMSLGKYLRFEDAPYLPGVLDKIISEARRDRAEFGFAQLRLVLCFLRWHNLKEEPTERINSPLLLLPVELTKKKGVRDNYVLDPTASEAEVNPALRHHLKELYGLNLPEAVDLRETSLDQFYEALKAQIQASEPGVMLHKVDRPQIQLIHERARQRLNEYRRRMKLRARPAGRFEAMEYSYERQNLRPLGLQIFRQKVQPSPAPLRDVAGAPPAPRQPNITEPHSPAAEGKVLETERQMFALREGEGRNPYSWDFDLCSLTLGNFNYRKMTLVRDYTNLIETDLASTAFDTIFSLTAKPLAEAAAPALELAEQHLIVPCDAAQASAIARARTGRSYIIQGPPGTGKSQTITNLIADYVARGKRVLFVCEKRAAIDVVFHRLRQQGLDELGCLIHDSQTDKKAFVQNLKQTYEAFLSQTEAENPEPVQAEKLRAMEQDLASLRRFSDAMRQTHEHIGLALRALLHRVVEQGCGPVALSPEMEELLPDYRAWLAHGELVVRLATALTDLGEEPRWSTHPLRWLGKGVILAERPLETLRAYMDKAETLMDALESALELSGLPDDLWDALSEIEAILAFAGKLVPLARKNLLGLLDPQTAVSHDFATLAGELAAKRAAYQQAAENTVGWRNRLGPVDTQNALEQARRWETALFRFLSPGFWRLRKTLKERYDFARHAVPPSWVKLLEDLAAEHKTLMAYQGAQDQALRDWGAGDPEAFAAYVRELQASPDLGHPSVRMLGRKLGELPEAGEVVETLAGLSARFAELKEILEQLFVEHQRFDFPALGEMLSGLREQMGILPELLPVLTELAELPEAFSRALREVPLPLPAFESAMALRSLNRVYRQDRALSRFDGRALAQRMERLAAHYRDWLGRNAACIRAGVRRKFLEHVNLSSLPLSQLEADQKQFKKAYSAGRRDLEHEFGKTMRYKSIRDLAADQTGQVIQDLKPIWLMSPLSVSDTLPLDPDLFDVVIFDEASQIPLEEAIPALYRSHQAIVVGDEMQLPPTSFFATSHADEDSVVVEEEGERIEVDLDADSFLAQSGQNVPSTLLAWHYRSRYESLISFSNAAYYGGNLFTIPDRQRAMAGRPELRITAADQAAANVEAILARSLSFHFLENGVYEQRRNAGEAAYVARLVRGLLQRDTGLSIGIVAFSEAQQSEIEDALGALAAEDPEFGARLEAEYVREENDQFCGLFVKNLENVQGDERDIIILSICYGYDPQRRMLMNFGPINQRGGEKRLNVIFSRSKHHMAVVSSIRHVDITNDYNDGANSLKNFLQYAEAVSKGDERGARRVLENLNPLTRKALAPEGQGDAVVESLAAALRQRGYAVDLRVGQSKFRCDLAVGGAGDDLFQLGILVDTSAHYANPNLLDRYLLQPGILRSFGWKFALVLTKDWVHEPEAVLKRLEALLQNEPVQDEPAEPELPEPPPGKTQAIPPPIPVPLPPPLPAPEEKASVPQAKAQPPVVLPKPAPPPLPVSTAEVQAEAGARYFEFIGGNSKKFWEIKLSGASFTVRFGRIGAHGQTQSKTFPDESRARREAEKLIAEKLKKGYQEK